MVSGVFFKINKKNISSDLTKITVKLIRINIFELLITFYHNAVLEINHCIDFFNPQIKSIVIYLKNSIYTFEIVFLNYMYT